MLYRRLPIYGCINWLSLVLRFVDSDGYIHGEFLGFNSLQRITGKAIASSILDTLPQWNLDIKTVRDKGTLERLIYHPLGTVQRH